MVTRTFEDLTFPMFGFGLMRLPNKEDGELDWEKSIELVRYGYNKGIRYFDTAWPYLGGNSERIAGEALSAFPRESYLLATKFPGHKAPECRRQSGASQDLRQWLCQPRHGQELPH